jgi:hypothetical protein
MPEKNVHKISLILLLCAAVFFLSGCDPKRLVEPPGEQERQAAQKRQDERDKEMASRNIALHPELLQQEKTTSITQTTSETNTAVQYSIDRPEGDPVSIININSLLAVFGGGTSPTVTFNQNYYLTDILTYHWNDGKGPPAGTIALQDSKGKTYGPWATTLVSGVYWTAKPSITLPAGTYTVIDSDPGTWSQNTETGGKGITTASGIPVK